VRREEIRSTFIVMVGLGATTATGYLREAALAYQLGAGRAADVFLIAFAVPEFVITALPIILSAAFIPLFAAIRQRAGEVPAWRFGLQTAGSLAALLLGIAVLAAWGAPLYIRWLAPGFETWEQAAAVQALYRMLPAIVLMGGANLVTAALHVYRRFARPALASAMNNLVFIAALLGLPLAWAVGRAAWGVTLGAASALLVQLPLLWALRPRPRGASPTGDSRAELHPTIRDLARLAGPLTTGYAVHHAILFVDRAMASTLGAGGVATLNYGYRLALVLAQLSGLAVSTAVFPGMAEQADRKDDAGLRASLAGALGLVWAIGAPACAGLILLRVPVVHVLFERGAFDQEATAAVSGVLRWYAPAVLADALCMPLWRVVYAWRSGRTVLAVNGLQTLIRLTGNVALMPRFGYDGLALSAAIGLSVQLLVLLWTVRRRLGSYLTPAWWWQVFRVIAATGCALVVAGLLHGTLSTVPALIDLIVSGSAGSLTYLLALRLLKEKNRR
jgi:putative peptidoglycan lipid II flippase